MQVQSPSATGNPLLRESPANEGRIRQSRDREDGSSSLPNTSYRNTLASFAALIPLYLLYFSTAAALSALTISSPRCRVWHLQLIGLAVFAPVSFLAGVAVDRLGRKAVLLPSVLCMMGGALGLLLVPSWTRGLLDEHSATAAAMKTPALTIVEQQYDRGTLPHYRHFYHAHDDATTIGSSGSSSAPAPPSVAAVPFASPSRELSKRSSKSEAASAPFPYFATPFLVLHYGGATGATLASAVLLAETAKPAQRHLAVAALLLTGGVGKFAFSLIGLTAATRVPEYYSSTSSPYGSPTGVGGGGGTGSRSTEAPANMSSLLSMFDDDVPDSRNSSLRLLLRMETGSSTSSNDSLNDDGRVGGPHLHESGAAAMSGDEAVHLSSAAAAGELRHQQRQPQQQQLRRDTRRGDNGAVAAFAATGKAAVATPLFAAHRAILLLTLAVAAVALPAVLFLCRDAPVGPLRTAAHG
eukprot:GHVU01097027.1.p1 GENE.GHVU01097027.1~~GHVU01097027.1.p1  ORF type:complete len:468 (+),score=58.16 GHVU01097027.1:301-1704(+)